MILSNLSWRSEIFSLSLNDSQFLIDRSQGLILLIINLLFDRCFLHHFIKNLLVNLRNRGKGHLFYSSQLLKFTLCFLFNLTFLGFQFGPFLYQFLHLTIHLQIPFFELIFDFGFYLLKFFPLPLNFL